MASSSSQLVGRDDMLRPGAVPPRPMEPFGNSGGGGAGAGQATCNVNSPVQDSEDFDPQPRDRCNSWPLQKSSRSDFVHHTSPLIHEEIPEEGSDSGSTNDLTGAVNHHHHHHHHHLHHHQQQHQGGSVITSSSEVLAPTLSTGSINDFSAAAAAANKRSSSRRNAWGNLSYADLITQAILSAPDKRLTLSQIYDWMVKNVPYFRDKGDSNSSAGWKNSIRHNLSLHSRFMRIQNEGPGKSSWWVIDPDAKPGKSSRRRAGSMEISKKLDKKRGRVRKKMEQLRQGAAAVAGPQGAGSTSALAAAGDNNGAQAGGGGGGGVMTVLSPSMSESSDLLDGGGGGGGASNMMSFSLSPASDFRNRSNSAVSSYSLGAGGGCLSPKFESHFEDWVDEVQSLHGASGGTAELVESMSHSMSLVEPPPYGSSSGGAQSQQQQQQQQRSFLYSTVDDDVGAGSTTVASPAKYLVISSQQQRQQLQHMGAGIFSTAAQGLSPPSSMVAAKNPVVYQSSTGLKAGASDQPLPQYRDLFGANPQQQQLNLPSSSTSSSSNRMLRQVLTKTEGVLTAPSSRMMQEAQMMRGMGQQQSMRHQLQQQGGGGGGGGMLPPSVCSPFAQDLIPSYSPAQLQSNGQLPSELSEIMYDTEIQCDIDQVIRHELNIAGNLDFSADNFGNI